MNFIHNAGMIPLPPFESLVAFDTAVRLRSMTRAAAELGLTQSAISHRIRRLERFMGTALLFRHNAGLVPTPAGEALIGGLGELLGGLADLKAQCLKAAGEDRLRLGVGAALAQNWLLRRLPGFAELHPEIAIELVIVENEAPEKVADLDLHLLWVPAADLRATTTQRPLFRERVFPVCHPALLPPGFMPGDPAILSTLPLLHKGPAGRATSAEWSWPAWLARLGLPPRPKESFRLASIGPAITAAEQRAGAVLGRTMLVHDALIDGKLARILPASHDLPSGKAHMVRWPSARRTDARVTRFVDWLCSKAIETDRAEAAIGQD